MKTDVVQFFMKWMKDGKCKGIIESYQPLQVQSMSGGLGTIV